MISSMHDRSIKSDLKEQRPKKAPSKMETPDHPSLRTNKGFGKIVASGYR